MRSENYWTIRYSHVSQMEGPGSDWLDKLALPQGQEMTGTTISSPMTVADWTQVRGEGDVEGGTGIHHSGYHKSQVEEGRRRTQVNVVAPGTPFNGFHTHTLITDSLQPGASQQLQQQH